MRSIHSKLFLQIGILVTGMIILLLVINTWLAEPYYLYTQQEEMIDFYEQIKALDDLETDEAIELFSTMEQSYGVEVLLLDQEGVPMYTSTGYRNDDRAGRPHPGPLPPLTIETVKTLDDGTVVSKTKEEIFGIENLLLSNELKDGSTIELRTAVHYIQTAIKTINEILMLTGAIFVSFSMIFAYLLARSFTKPILEINNATRQMQNLDFDGYCDISSNDELGQLSENINSMSDVLSETIDTLHVRDDKRRMLLNNVSHELKTPLTLMQGYTVGLKRSVVNNTDKIDFYTEVIIDETLKMNRLVESLLDIDQLETEERRLNLRSFDINAFVEENFRKFENILEEEGVSSQITYCEPTKVQCDPDLTEQVIKNLMTNAIVHSKEPKTVHVEIIAKASSVRVSVSNSSEPISKQELNQLWDRFYKKDKARTRDRGGHGLGLSIVKAIQEAHHQGYGADLLPEGVCFWIEIDKDQSSEL